MIVWIAIFLTLCVSLSSAEDEYDHIRNMTMEELMQIQIKVSASAPSEIFSSPSVVSVIDKDMIKNFHFETVAEAVRIVAGVDIAQTNLDRNVETFRGIMQNYYNNKVLLLINNIPTWLTIYGNHTLDRININDVERIEILKGAASVLYGTNAYSGVINVITKLPEESELTAQAKVGVPGVNAVSVNVSQKFFELVAVLSFSNSNEEREPYLMDFAPDISSEEIGVSKTYDSVFYFQEIEHSNTANLNLKYKEHSFFVNLFEHEFTYPGMNISYATAAGSMFRDKGVLAAYSINELKLLDPLAFNFQVYYDHFVRDYPNNADKTTGIKLSGDKIGSSANLNYTLNDHWKFEVGADIFRGVDYSHTTYFIPLDTVLGSNMIGEKAITEYSAFAQASINYSPVCLLLGTRVTGNDIFGSNISSRATANIKISKTSAIKLIYGESYRTPNMLELYFNHPTVLGNNSLQPEKSASHELAFLSKFNNFFIQSTIFYSKYSNLIQRIRPDVTQPAKYRNVGEFAGYGAELELKYVNKEILNAYLNYNYVAGEDNYEAYSNLRFAPKHTVSYGLSKDFGNFTISANGMYYSKTDALLEEIPAQYTLNLHGSYHHHVKFFVGLTHTLSITNINGSDMLIPEYIRRRQNVNSLPTAAFGRRFIYSIAVEL